MNYEYPDPILLKILEYCITNDVYNTEVQSDDGNRLYSIIIRNDNPSIKSLTKHLGNYSRITSTDDLLKNNDTCSICCNNFAIKEYKRQLPKCKHQFHKKCIDKWFSKNVESMNCPICRENYNNIISI